MSAAQERFRVAVHEAAHAVAAVELGLEVGEVVVSGNAGRCDLRPGRTSFEWYDAVTEAIVALVAPLAVERIPVPPDIEVPVEIRVEEVVEERAEELYPSRIFDPLLDDQSHAERLLAGSAVDEEEAAALLRVAELRATALAESDRFKLLVRHVADLFCREGQLSGEDVRIEMERLDWRLRFAANVVAEDPPS
jgi:hypothetical protein